MRIFVTGTGRCGTCTAYQALSHAKGFTVGHESRAGLSEHHEYPDNHIEVSSQLVMEIPLLLRKYPGAYWVHLQRERKATVNSLIMNCEESMAAYSLQWLQRPIAAVDDEDSELRGRQLRAAASIYYDNVNAMLSKILPSFRTYYLPLEYVDGKWADCWEFLQLTGDFEASQREWSRQYNAAEFRGRDNYSGANQ